MQFYIKCFLFSIYAIGCSVMASSQTSLSTHECGFNDDLPSNQNLDILSIDGSRQAALLIIPTVVHIIHIGEPLGVGTNISEAQILSALVSLNDDFRKTIGSNGDGLGVDTEIEFCLANRDPLGNPTSGITRTDGSVIAGYFNDGIKSGNIGVGANESELKSLVAWPRNMYCNIFVVTEIDGNNGGNGTQGYSYFPFDDVRDGVTILYNAFGTVGNLKTWSNLNRTLTHELGHYLGLYHTFHNTGSVLACASETSCITQGDQICDTPPTIANYACVLNPSCSLAQIENYMDYTTQECKNTYTNDQSLRMRSVILNQRSSLLGTNVCIPVTDRDLGISQILDPEIITCSPWTIPKVNVINYGLLPATALSLQAVMDNAQTVNLVWSGVLNSGASLELILDSMNVSMGGHLVEVSVNWLAAGVDNWSPNNISVRNFSRDLLEECVVLVDPDYFGSETTWSLKDAAGSILMQGGPYENNNLSYFYKRSTCLQDGCYEFSVQDAFGDGMSFGGTYEVLNGAGEVWASGGGDFGAESVHILCVGPVPGCMYSFAANYNPQATYDDGSCFLSGCLDPIACNYLVNASIDDGSCIYSSLNCTGDLDNNGIISISDLLLFLLLIGSAC